MSIPKLIHFIWAGGEKLLPEQNAARIKAWAAKNPDFEIWLWIDKKTTSKEKLDEYYSSHYFHETPEIVLKDITEEEVVDEYSRYHIDKLEPNYGASSDLLRYSILKKYGGAYFDSDVIVTEESKPLNHAGLFNLDKKEILRITHFSQNHYVIGNDAFICTPEHPFMVALYRKAKDNHDLNTWSTSLYRFNTLGALANWTIKTTGPEVVRQVCLDHNLVEKSDSNKTKDLSLSLDRSCYQPAERNDANWLWALSRQCKDLDESLKITLASIHFEIKHMKVLAIDYHISEIVKSLNLIPAYISDKIEPTEDEIQVAERVIHMLSNTALDLANCNTVQLITRYKNVADYYRKFTPMLVDGDIEASEKEIYDLCFGKNKNDSMSNMIIHNYFSHLLNQLDNQIDIYRVLSTKKANLTSEERRIKRHTKAIMENYVLTGGDLVLAESNLPGLSMWGFQKDIWIKSFFDILIEISRISFEGRVSGLKKIINDHLKTYPGHQKSILYVLNSLCWDRFIVDGEKIRLTDETASQIGKIRNELSADYRAAPRSRKTARTLFHQSDLTRVACKEPDMRNQICQLKRDNLFKTPEIPISFFSEQLRKQEKEFLIRHRHDNAVLQNEYDRQFGIILN